MKKFETEMQLNWKWFRLVSFIAEKLWLSHWCHDNDNVSMYLFLVHDVKLQYQWNAICLQCGRNENIGIIVHFLELSEWINKCLTANIKLILKCFDLFIRFVGDLKNSYLNCEMHWFQDFDTIIVWFIRANYIQYERVVSFSDTF